MSAKVIDLAEFRRRRGDADEGYDIETPETANRKRGERP